MIPSKQDDQVSVLPRLRSPTRDQLSWYRRRRATCVPSMCTGQICSDAPDFACSETASQMAVARDRAGVHCRPNWAKPSELPRRSRPLDVDEGWTQRPAATRNGLRSPMRSGVSTVSIWMLASGGRRQASTQAPSGTLEVVHPAGRCSCPRCPDDAWPRWRRLALVTSSPSDANLATNIGRNGDHFDPTHDAKMPIHDRPRGE